MHLYSYIERHDVVVSVRLGLAATPPTINFSPILLLALYDFNPLTRFQQ